MKNKLILIFAFLLIVSGGRAISAQDEVLENPDAPEFYDANLKPNDIAIGSAGGSALEKIRIVFKSGNVYKAVSLESPNENEVFYKANSVYPYFDRREFEVLVNDHRKQLQAYLECYAKKNKLDYEKIKGDGPMMFDIGWGNAKEIRESLSGDLPKLAALAEQLKTKFPARPNTYMDYESNPALVEDIAVNREQYFQCVMGEKDARRFDESVWLSAHRDGIFKDLKRVEEYDPAKFITMSTSSEYMLYAVSPKARAEWLADANAADFKEPIDKLLNPLAEALAKKLPSYLPDATAYKVHNAAEEAILKTALSNPSRYKIFSIGLNETNWLIDKNSLGIPTARYKHGRIYLRDTAADHPYCYATYVNLKQDYAGGGTYEASAGVFIQDELVGCPK